MDNRAEQMIELLRYGTNNSKHILLMRYGFPPEMIAEISQYVANIDETKIAFQETIKSAPGIIQDFVEWYLPTNNTA